MTDGLDWSTICAYFSPSQRSQHPFLFCQKSCFIYFSLLDTCRMLVFNTALRSYSNAVHILHPFRSAALNQSQANIFCISQAAHILPDFQTKLLRETHFRNSSYTALSPAEKQQKITSRLGWSVNTAFTSRTAISATSRMGQPYTPVEMQGKAIERQPFSMATASESR